MTASVVDSEARQTDINNSCFVKSYSIPKRVHSWPHQRKVTMVVVRSPHQRLTSSCYTPGHCLLSLAAKWLWALSEGTGMRVYVQLYLSAGYQLENTGS